MSFGNLSIAVSALRAQQYGLSVTAHNVANAETEGYSRQVANMSATRPVTLANGLNTSGQMQIGTGVVVDSIRRVQDTLLQAQINKQSTETGYWESYNQTMQQIEALLNEPGDIGISSQLDAFWNSWQDLANAPESLAARATIVEEGIQVCDRITSMFQNLRNTQTRINSIISDDIDTINMLARQIADLNGSITSALEVGNSSNDYMDKRDLLVKQLAEYANLEVHGSGSEMIISIGGKPIVQAAQSFEITTTFGAGGATDLVWADDGSPVSIRNGKIASLIELRDTNIAGYIDSLNQIAEAVIEQVNAVHTTGFDINGDPAQPFFTEGADASNMSVNSAFINSPGLVAASITGASGDNTIANAISEIRDLIIADGKTINGMYNLLVSKIGSDTSRAEDESDIAQLTMNQLETYRESISGVSLDEEMANMTKYQQAYSAAARVFTIVDSMLDTLINRMGA